MKKLIFLLASLFITTNSYPQYRTYTYPDSTSVVIPESLKVNTIAGKDSSYYFYFDKTDSTIKINIEGNITNMAGKENFNNITYNIDSMSVYLPLDRGKVKDYSMNEDHIASNVVFHDKLAKRR